MINLKIKDNFEFSNCDEQLSKSIPNQLNEEANLENQKLYYTFRSHAMSFKDMCLIAIETEKIQKSIILYLMMMSIEMYVKAEIINKFKISNYLVEISTNLHSSKKLSIENIGHNFVHILENLNIEKDEYPDLKHLLKISEELEVVFGEYPTFNRYKYVSLRYNCDKKGKLIFEDDSYCEGICALVKEVLKYVY